MSNWARGMVKRKIRKRGDFRKKQIMDYLRLHGEAKTSEIATKLILSSSTIREWLKELEREGKVERFKKIGVTYWRCKYRDD